MFRKTISLLLVLCMVLCLGVTAFADVQWFGLEQYIHGNGREVNNIKYCTAANDVEALVIASKGGISNYRILSEYYGMPVVEIMDYAFDCNWDLKSVSIPNTVRVIGNSAFHACKDLKSVTLPSGLKKLGEYAFAGTGLTAVTIPASVEYLGQFAFNLCSALTSLTIEPGSLHYIGSYAFSDCDSLRTVELPQTVTTLSENAFSDCGALESFRAPGVQVIGRDAFYFDTNLRSIVLSADLQRVDIAAFQSCSQLTDVYYGGTEEQWNAIEIKERNDPLLNANIHFNSALAQFTDLEPGAYYLDAVGWALQHEVTNGMGPNTFAPNGNCTRAQVVTFLWRAMGKPEPKSVATSFTDVPADIWYSKAVAWAVEQNITNGMSEHSFAPDATCTRAQVVTFLWRAKGMPEPGTANPFSDVAAGTYYYAPVLWANENSVTNGTDATHFSPQNTCIRAQVVTFLYRALK